MSSSHSTKAISYPDAVRAFNDKDVLADLNDACAKLAQSTTALMMKFDSISTQLRTIDLQGWSAPLRPGWTTLHNTFRELVWQFRTNAGFISARLKLFCTVVLPLTARNPNGGSSRLHDEKLQVLQSFMNISADHTTLTRSLAENALKMNALLGSFHTDFSKLVSHKASSGQKELRDLAHQLHQLEGHVRQLCIANGRLAGPDVTYLVFSAFRVVGFSGRRSSKAKTSHKRLALNGADLAPVARLYDQLEQMRNEVAHAHYIAQISLQKTDALTSTHTAVSSLATDEMLTIESVMSLFLSIWSRLRIDCTDILQWLQNPRRYPDVLATYMESGWTLYAALAGALDIYVAGLDQSRSAHHS